MSKQLILFPFGGNAREALVTILAINSNKAEWNVLGFLDDDSTTRGNEVCGVNVLGGREKFKEYPEAYVLAVPGRPKDFLKRKEIIDSLEIESSRWATIIHPSVSVAPDAQIGSNTLIMPNVVISCGVSIGNHCVILPNAVVSHDTAIGDYCSIGSNVSVSGFVRVGEGSYIGSGAKIRENMTIGAHSLVGIGSNVIADVDEGVIVAGNPAKFMRESDK